MYADLIANVMVFIFLMEMNGNQDIWGQIHETLHRFIATTRYMQKKKNEICKSVLLSDLQSYPGESHKWMYITCLQIKPPGSDAC